MRAPPKLATVTRLSERRSRTRWVVAVMSGAKRTGRWRPGEHCAAIAMMGGKDITIADVPIGSGTPLIRVRALSMTGGVTVESKPLRSRGGR